MGRFVVATDKEFFERFSTFSSDIMTLSAYFQNPGLEFLEADVAEFKRRAKAMQDDLTSLLQEAEGRFVLVKN